MGILTDAEVRLGHGAEPPPVWLGVLNEKNTKSCDDRETVRWRGSRDS